MVSREGGQRKRQHFVPQAYLRRFAIGSKIAVYDKPTGKVFRTKVANVACESRFYDLPEWTVPDPDHPGEALTADLQAVEELLSYYESPIPSAVGSIIAEADAVGPGGRLSEEHKESLSAFLALQYVRSSTIRLSMRQAAEMMERQVAHLAEGAREVQHRS